MGGIDPLRPDSLHRIRCAMLRDPPKSARIKMVEKVVLNHGFGGGKDIVWNYD